MVMSSFLFGCASGSPANTTPSSTESAAAPTTSSTTSGVTAKQSETGLPELPEDVKAKGKLVVGVKSDFPPFGFIAQDGSQVGYDVDIAKKLAQYAFGDENAIELVTVTSANRIPFLTSKKVDLLLASMAITDERKKQIDFTSIYMSTGHLILTLANNNDIIGIDDLADKRVIVLDGTTGEAAVKKLAPTATEVKYETWSEALKALKDGRGVAIVHDESVLYEAAAGDNNLKIIGKPFENTLVAGGVRKGEEEWLNWLDAALGEMKKDDFFYEKFQSFFKNWTNVPEGLPRAE